MRRTLIVALVLAGAFLLGVMVSFLANATNKQVIYGRHVAAAALSTHTDSNPSLMAPAGEHRAS
jgi:hypothetical protein